MNPQTREEDRGAPLPEAAVIRMVRSRLGLVVLAVGVVLALFDPEHYNIHDFITVALAAVGGTAADWSEIKGAARNILERGK